MLPSASLNWKAANMTVTTEQLAAFCAAVDAKRKAYFIAQGYDSQVPHMDPTTFEMGAKNARIVVSEYKGTHRSAFCFVRLEDGAILKTAGWKAPAKGVRGNIANGAADVGPYGAAYAR